MNTEKTLNEKNAVSAKPSSAHGAHYRRLFACFERFELCFFVVDSTQFTETAQSVTRKWEAVDLAWLTHVKGLIENSVEAPKSLARLMGVTDLFYRAQGIWLLLGGEVPGWIVGGEAGVTEVVAVERMSAAIHTRESGGGQRDLWGDECGDAWELAEILAGTFDEASRRRRSTPAEATPRTTGPKKQRAELIPPAIPQGAAVRIMAKLESFGVFLSPGEAVVSQVYCDEHGGGMVDLSRGGRVVASGVAWPAAGIQLI